MYNTYYQDSIILSLVDDLTMYINRAIKLIGGLYSEFNTLITDNNESYLLIQKYSNVKRVYSIERFDTLITMSKTHINYMLDRMTVLWTTLNMSPCEYVVGVGPFIQTIIYNGHQIRDKLTTLKFDASLISSNTLSAYTQFASPDDMSWTNRKQN